MNTKYFRTVSIIMLICGILGALSGFSMLSSASWALASGVISLVNSLLLIVAGVMGTKAVKTGDDAKVALCKKLGIALIAIAVIGIVVGLIGSAQTVIPGVSAGMVMGMSVIGGVVSLILPILYFFGAKKLGE